MGIFYERIEEEKKITIRYKNLPAYYLLLAGLVLGVYTSSIFGQFSYIVSGVGIVAMAIFIIDVWIASNEVRNATKTRKVTMNGSKFSFSNPLVVEIPKK